MVKFRTYPQNRNVKLLSLITSHTPVDPPPKDLRRVPPCHPPTNQEGGNILITKEGPSFEAIKGKYITLRLPCSPPEERRKDNDSPADKSAQTMTPDANTGWANERFNSLSDAVSPKEPSIYLRKRRSRRSPTKKNTKKVPPNKRDENVKVGRRRKISRKFPQ